MKVGAAIGVLFLALSLESVLGAAPYGWDYGHITYYGSPNGAGTQGGSCGYQNTFALGYGVNTAAVSSVLYQGGSACGACFELRCAPPNQYGSVKNWCSSYARSIIVTATNLCPPGSIGGWCNPPNVHFDLPIPTFTQLARKEGGVSPVYYRRVKCAKRGGVRFTLGGNPFFIMILIHNVGGAGNVKAAFVKGPYTGWIQLSRNWGSLWTCQTKMQGALSFKLILGDNSVLISNNAVRQGWKFGQTWEGTQSR